jgi:sterol desaturase/sphingolipid hydroxylase (fatty acid hydroxylase superfamily)
MDLLLRFGPLGLYALTLGLMLVLGALFPRQAGLGFVTRDMGLNVANGALLFVLRLTIFKAAEPFFALGLVDAGGWPVWMQALVGFLALDLVRYGLHFAHHRVPFLWSFHRVHHSAETVDATTGLRMHVVDFVQLSLLPPLLFSTVLNTTGWNPWVLPGVLLIGQLMDAFQHANLRFPMGHPLCRAWNLLFNNPHFHAWHHTRDGHVLDGNYGNTLVVWDRLFGTDVSRDVPPGLYGIAPWKQLQQSLIGFWLLRRQRPEEDPVDRPELFDPNSSRPPYRPW